jgi:inosine-uridine nucleoside N-ribohydrolase
LGVTSNKQTKRIPVILDTDIGTDIDDSWALAFLLKSPEVDLKYILTATGDTAYRAKVAAKMLLAAGRTDIPIGIGRPVGDYSQTLESWARHFDIQEYPGKVYPGGTEQLVHQVMSLHGQEPVILCIGPMTNLGDALRLCPDIARSCHLVTMSGSFNKHEDGRKGQIAEWNVCHDISAAQAVYSASWKSIRIAPLDSCGVLRLDGECLQQVRAADSLLTKTLIQSVDCWAQNVKNREWPECSSILFDTVAAYLCFGSDYLKMETLCFYVDDEGFMNLSDDGALVECALDWKDMAGFRQMLSERLTEEG